MLRPLLSNEAALGAYVDVLNAVCSGTLTSEELAPFAASNLVGLGKPNSTGVRPIGMGDVLLRRTPARAAVTQLKPVVRKAFAPQQLGLAVANGVETTGRALQLHLERNPSHIVLAVDIANAFNTASRASSASRLRHGLDGSLSGLRPLHAAFYGQPNRLWVDMGPGAPPASFDAAEGTTQGCPLASLVFDATIHPELQAAADSLDEHGGLALGIHDDVHLAGPPAEVFQTFRTLKADLLAHHGLRVKPSKSRVLRLAGSLDVAAVGVELECGAGDVLPVCFDAATPAAARGFVAVGIPIGTPEFVAAETLRLARVAAALLPERLAALLCDHVHEAQLALRKCAVPSLMFLCRSVPPSLAGPAAAEFDAATTRCLLSLLREPAAAVPPGSAAHRQLQLPLGSALGAMGGLGVVSLHAVGPAAHAASVQASLGLLESIRPSLVEGLGAPLPATQAELATAALPLAAATPSVLAFHHALVSLPVASYDDLRDAMEGFPGGAGGGDGGGSGGGTPPAGDELPDERGLQHRLTAPVMVAARDAFLAQLEAECAGSAGLFAVARAQWLSFAGGGALFLENWTPLPGLLGWHIRLFLRSALRLPHVPAAAGSSPCRLSCPQCQAAHPAGLLAVQHALTCGNTVRRHHSFAVAGRSVLSSLPGQPSLRREVSGLPAPGCRMDAVVDGALVGPAPSAASPAAGGGSPDTRRLLVDFMVIEPTGVTLLAAKRTDTVAGAAAADGAAGKVRRYAPLVDTERCRLVPFVTETWGRLDSGLQAFLLGAARIAAFRVAGRDAASSDDAEKRRDARVAASVLRGWHICLSAGVARSVAEHLDRAFAPLGGTADRESTVARAPQGVFGGGSTGEGLLGRSGRARMRAPQLTFA
jgi:hypothetical protein